MGQAGDPARSDHAGDPLAHAFILRVVSEFQAFARDLHDLAVELLVAATGIAGSLQGNLTSGMTLGRGIDRGNASVPTLQADSRRIGLHEMNARIGATEPRWASPNHAGPDRKLYENLVTLRKALAHGNQVELTALRSRGVYDTVAATRDTALPALDRLASSLDHLVWDHLSGAIGEEPW